VHKFWLTATVEGVLIKELHSEVLKESAKKANFPGFRKGQVPPYAMGQIRGFSVQEGIIRTCQAACDAFGLKSLKGKEGEVEVLEDIPEVAKDYKLGDPVQFTATFNALFDPEVSRPETDATDAASQVIDVEAKETTTTTADVTE
jgi:FKBP-type peptidyl-prolyl cis-trans isomerase (trigger factor)